jgi:hypothetical protein
MSFFFTKMHLILMDQLKFWWGCLGYQLARTPRQNTWRSGCPVLMLSQTLACICPECELDPRPHVRTLGTWVVYSCAGSDPNIILCWGWLALTVTGSQVRASTWGQLALRLQ